MRLLLCLCFIPLFLTSCYQVDEIDLRLSGGAINNPPVITNSTLNVIHTMVLPVELAATDVEGASLTYTIISGPTNGTLLGSGASRTYVANTGFLGTDSITISQVTARKLRVLEQLRSMSRLSQRHMHLEDRPLSLLLLSLRMGTLLSWVVPHHPEQK